MIPRTEMLQHYRTLATGISPALPIQQKAAMHLQELNLPSKKDEDWHYTPLAPLLEYRFAANNDAFVEPHFKDIKKFLLGEQDGPRIVLVNGCFHPGLSCISDTIDGLSVGSIQAEAVRKNKDVTNNLGALSGEGSHLFSALNTAVFNDGAWIRIAHDAVIEKPIELLHLTIAASGTPIFQPRNLIMLEEGASAMVIESSVSAGSNPCFNNMISEIFLGRNTGLEHLRLQNVNRVSRHLAGLYIREEENSHYHCTNTDLGANWSRTEFNVDFAGENAECTLNGLYLAGDDQSTSIHLNISHAAPGCISHEFFKGILKGKGKAVFDGNVIVEKDAQKTDAHLKNANLLLSREAEIDTKPVLQINADDVQCSHGTTVGQIDPELLFYLQARGIPEPQARKMISLGFAKEILQRYPLPAIREMIEGILEVRLADIETVED